MGCCFISKQRQAQLKQCARALRARTSQLQENASYYRSQNNGLQITISNLASKDTVQQNENSMLSRINEEIKNLTRRKTQLSDSIDLINNQTSASRRQVEIVRLNKQLQALNWECYELQQQTRIVQQNPPEQIIVDEQIKNLQAQKNTLQMQILLIRQNLYLIKIENLDKNSATIQIKIEGSKTIREIKQIIYNDNNNQLIPSLMILLDNDFAQNVDQRIQDSFANPIVNLKLRKAEVWELQGLRTDKYAEDSIFFERGVAFVQCGHNFSRSVMKYIIEKQIKETKNHYFTCPYTKEGQDVLCSQMLLTDECQMIAGYTKAEWEPIQKELNQLYIKQTTKQCPNPKCQKSISRLGVTIKRVKCPVCRVGDFCIACGESWQWKGNTDCFSQGCNGINQIIAKAPRDRIFNLKVKGTNKQQKVYAPNLRACPNCKCLVMNTQRCKHTKCYCGRSFCFVCLRLSNPNSRPQWPCGDNPFQFCELVLNQHFGKDN